MIRLNMSFPVLNVLRNIAIDFWRSPPVSLHTFTKDTETELMDVYLQWTECGGQYWFAAVSLLNFWGIIQRGNLDEQEQDIEVIIPLAF